MRQDILTAYGAMGSVSLGALFLPVPVYVHMMVLSLGCIYIASHNSTKQEVKEAGEKMESKDAYMFPFIGSAVLFSLYLVFKFLPTYYVNLVIKAYFFVFGVVVLGQKVASILEEVVSEETIKPLKDSQHVITLPYFTQPKKTDKKSGESKTKESEAKTEGDNKETEPQTIEFNKLDVVGCLIASVNGVVYLWSNHWICSNLFGVAFSMQGIEMLNLGSFFNGAVLLAGLFFYDIFWVFGTDVMVTVAKSFDAPIKLLFPQMWEVKQSMLGLGDVVIPGIFVALMLRFDLSRQKSGIEGTPYFNAVLLAYGAGLSTTVLVMYGFNAAQPALLYLVPACLGSTTALAAFRGELNLLAKYEETADEEEEKADTKKDK